jgi:hypothetical protein
LLQQNIRILLCLALPAPSLIISIFASAAVQGSRGVLARKMRLNYGAAAVTPRKNTTLIKGAG